MIDLKKMPSCPLEARIFLISEYAVNRARLTVEYIKNRFQQSKKFEEAINFVDHDLLDCMRSDFESLGRVWLFPATEASNELSECLNRILDCSYKGSRDNMRRALELILVGVYFSHSHISLEDAKCWLNSTDKTPNFSQVIKDLSLLPRFKQFNADYNWASIISNYYWDLCDTVHTRGRKYSLGELQPVHDTINSIRIPEFNEDALRVSLDLFLQTVSHIAMILAVYNPVLLIGLPLLKKFGDNPPLTGFFEEPQAEMLWKLIPANFYPILRHIIETDEEVLSVIEWMKNLPDKF
jgi:hypothetical protein